MKRLTQVLMLFLGMLALALSTHISQAQSAIFFEDFEGTFPPSGWTTIDNEGNGGYWLRNDATGGNNEIDYSGTTASGYSAAADPDALGTSYDWDADLITPSIDLTSYTSAKLEFESNFQDFAGNGDAYVDISTNGGTTWNNIWSQSTDQSSTGQFMSFNIDTYTGNSVKIRFKYECTSSTTWFWHIDNVSVLVTLPLDAGMASIDGPAQPAALGSNNVEATIQNFGLNNLTSATINWSVNGTTQTPYSWTGSLATGATDGPITLGSATFTSGLNDVEVWTSSPNGLTDPNTANDKVEASILACNPLSGSYTIGASGDFPTFTDAVNALQLCGLAGPVNFFVMNGTYNEQITIPFITGMSASNLITFQSLSGNAASVVLNYAPTGFSDNWTVLLEDADFVVFRNLTIQTDPTGTSAYAKVLVFEDGADNNIIEQCVLNGRDISTSSTNYAVIYSSGTHYAQNNIITNNTINNGTAGIYFQSSSTTYSLGNVITNNTINGFTYYGIRVYGQESVVVEENILTSSSTTYSSLYGIYAYYCDSNSTFNANMVNLTGSSSSYGLYMYQCDGGPGMEVLVSNNYIHLNGGTTTLYGIYSYNGMYHQIYNNTVLLSTGSGGTNEYAFYANSSTSGSYGNVDVQNNIFMNTAGGYAVYFSSGAAGLPYVSSMDYNNLYSPAGNIGRVGTTDAATLGDWQTLSGFDANSLSLDPVLTSATDPTPVSYAMDNQGTPLTVVSSDIYGNSRSMTTPDVGCVEYVAPTNPIMVLSETNYDFGLVEEGQTYTFTLHIQNVGPSALLIINNNVNSPFTCDLNASGIVTILPGQSDSCTVSFTPGSPGVWNETLNFIANTSTLNLSINLSGEAYPTGMVLQDFESGVFPPTDWTISSIGDDYGEWVENTTSPYSPSYVARAYEGISSSYYVNTQLATPFLDIQANSLLYFWGRCNQSPNSDGNNRIYLETIDNNGVVTIIDSFFLTTTWASYSSQLNGINGVYKLGFRYSYPTAAPDDFNWVYLDDILHPAEYVFPYDISVTKVSNDASVVAGSSYNYMIGIENKGANNDVYDLSFASAKAFTYDIRDKNDASSISTISIPAGQSDTVLLKVSVPMSSAHGDMEDVSFYAVSQGNSSLSDSASFTTSAVIPMAPPYFQDFSIYPPDRWSEAYGSWGNPSPAWTSSFSDWGSDYFGGDIANSQCAYINLYSSDELEWLLSPIFDLDAKANYQLDFDIAMTAYASTSATTMGSDDTLALLISYDGGITWNKSDTLKLWHAGTSISPTGDHYTIDLTGITGIVQFAFFAKSTISFSNDNDYFVDNFSVLDPTAVPVCTNPVNPADSAVDVNAPVLELQWSPTPNTTGYKLYLGTTNPPAFVMDVGDTNTYEATGLSFNTDYYWQAIPYNANGDAAGCDVWTFKTLSNPTVYQYPWYETFETFVEGSPGTLGEAWSITSTGSYEWNVESGTTISGSTGPNVDHTTGTSSGLYLYTEASSGSQGDSTIVQRDLIDLSVATTATLTFYYHMYGATIGQLYVEVETGAGWQTADSIIGEQQTANGDPWLMKEVDLAPYVGDTVNIRFVAIRGSSYTGDISIDDIGILVNGVAGDIVYGNAASTPLPGVDMTLNPLGLTTVSNDFGAFGYMPVANGTYTVSASTTMATGGVNTTDALWAIHDFVGMMSLGTLETAAADVNNDAAVNAADALLIQQYYVEMVNTFAAGMWQFEGGSVTVNNDITSATITGLGTGDVNGSYTPAMKSSSNVLIFDAEPMIVDANTEIEIPVYAAQAMRLGAMSLELNFPAGKLEITDVKLATGNDDIVWAAANGKLRISWFNTHAIEAIPGSAIFTITAIAKPYENVSFETGASSEFADTEARVIDNAAISIPKLTVLGIPAELGLNAYPNPSNGITNVNYDITEAGKVSLKLYNSLGELVKVLVDADHAAGSYQLSFDAANMPAGIYIGKLELNGMSSASRIVIQH